jgi:hypothetical protein
MFCRLAGDVAQAMMSAQITQQEVSTIFESPFDMMQEDQDSESSSSSVPIYWRVGEFTFLCIHRFSLLLCEMSSVVSEERWQADMWAYKHIVSRSNIMIKINE